MWQLFGGFIIQTNSRIIANFGNMQAFWGLAPFAFDQLSLGKREKGLFERGKKLIYFFGNFFLNYQNE